MEKIKEKLKQIFPFIKNRARVISILLIFLVLGIAYSRYLKAGIFALIFIVMSGASKIYHRLIKSTIGIDLVFFTTVMISLVYKNILLSLFVAWAGLILADSIGTRFSYTSIISLACLTLISFMSRFFGFMPIALAAIVLLVVYDIAAGFFYGIMGSSPDRIILFISSHFLFNLFLILSFAGQLASIMA